MSELAKTEDEALDGIRVAIENYRAFQVSEHPDSWKDGIVLDFMVIAVSQSIEEDGCMNYQSTACTTARLPKYRALGLLAMGQEIIDEMYETDE